MAKVPSLGIGKSIVAGGTGNEDSVQPVTWADNLDPNVLDWVGLFRPGTSDNDYLGSQRFTGAVSPSGSFPFVIPPVALGIYEMRLYSNKSTQRIATSPSFFISPIDRAIVGGIVMQGGSITPGGFMSFTWYRQVILGDPPGDACVIGMRKQGTTAILAQKTLHGNGGQDAVGIPPDAGSGELELVLFEGESLANPSNPTNLLLSRSPTAILDLALPVVTLTASADPVVATVEGVRRDVGWICSKPTALDQIIMWRLSSDLGNQPVGVAARMGTAGFIKGTLYPAIDAYTYGDGYYTARYRSLLLGSAYDVAETVAFRVTH